MRRIMLLASAGAGEQAEEVARDAARLNYEVIYPRDQADGDLKGIEQVDLFMLIGRQADSLEGLARTLQADPALAEIPRLVITEDKTLAELDYCRFADDFLLLPLRRGELAARLKLISWRNEKIDPSNVVNTGDLTINLSTYEVTVQGTLVDLTFKEYELLRYLMTHRRRVHTRRELLTRVWGDDYYGGARTVDVHIRRIRAKIETGGQLYIQTVRGVGYRFVS